MFDRHRPSLWAIAVLMTIGCRTQTPYQRTLPRAMQSHTGALRSASSVEVSVQVPPTVVWNRVAAMVAEACGVAEEDPTSGVIVSHFCYSNADEESTVARQLRSRLTVRVPPGTTDVSAVHLDVATEQRERPAGEPASQWAPVAPEAAVRSALRESIGAALAPTRSLPVTEVVFDGEPTEVLRRLRARLSPYVVEQQGNGEIVTEWRVTQNDMDPGTLWLRSRVRVLAEASEEGTRVTVIGQLQQRIDTPEEEEGEPHPEPMWTDLDAEPITAHGIAAVAEGLQARPIQLPDEDVRTLASAAPAEPPLNDPSAGWTATSLPDGVGTTTGGAMAEIISPENANPEQLVGRVFDASMQPAGGRVTGVGGLERSSHHESRSVFRQLEFESELSAGASYFGFGGSASRGQRSAVAVFTALVEEERVALPEYASFADVGSDASFYVAAVVLGRTLDVAMRSDEETIRLALEGSYAGCARRPRRPSAIVSLIAGWSRGATPVREATANPVVSPRPAHSCSRLRRRKEALPSC